MCQFIRGLSEFIRLNMGGNDKYNENSVKVKKHLFEMDQEDVFFVKRAKLVCKRLF